MRTPGIEQLLEQYAKILMITMNENGAPLTVEQLSQKTGIDELHVNMALYWCYENGFVEVGGKSS